MATETSGPTHLLDTLRADQQRGLIALLGEPTIKKAAESIGVGETTMHRWIREPAFAHAYREARRESFRHAVGLCNRYAPVAVQALAKIVADPKTASAVVVSAATALLKFSRESIELDDLAGRVEALERGDADPEVGTRPPTRPPTSPPAPEPPPTPPEDASGGPPLSHDPPNLPNQTTAVPRREAA